MSILSIQNGVSEMTATSLNVAVAVVYTYSGSGWLPTFEATGVKARKSTHTRFCIFIPVNIQRKSEDFLHCLEYSLQSCFLNYLLYNICSYMRTSVVTGSRRFSARLGIFRPSRLASAGALGPVFGVSPQLITFTCQLSLRYSILCVALAAHVRSGTCRAMLPRAPNDALPDSILNPTHR